MADRFQNKYRIESARLKHWDYGWNASYFITICTKDRDCFFGDVMDGEMVFNEIGRIAQDCWLEIPEHFPFVKLGNHVVMPNHVHGIVVIDKPDDERNDKSDGRNVPNVPNAPNVETPNLGVSTTAKRTNAASEKWNPGTLGVIVNQYKRAVTIRARKIHVDFAWQPRFHDHIIRDERSFQKITEYIINNPLNWSNDQFHI